MATARPCGGTPVTVRMRQRAAAAGSPSAMELARSWAPVQPQVMTSGHHRVRGARPTFRQARTPVSRNPADRRWLAYPRSLYGARGSGYPSTSIRIGGTSRIVGSGSRAAQQAGRLRHRTWHHRAGTPARDTRPTAAHACTGHTRDRSPAPRCCQRYRSPPC